MYPNGTWNIVVITSENQGLRRGVKGQLKVEKVKRFQFPNGLISGYVFGSRKK